VYLPTVGEDAPSWTRTTDRLRDARDTDELRGGLHAICGIGSEIEIATLFTIVSEQ
jgi:hypothetical protein